MLWVWVASRASAVAAMLNGVSYVQHGHTLNLVFLCTNGVLAFVWDALLWSEK